MGGSTGPGGGGVVAGGNDGAGPSGCSLMRIVAVTFDT
jgi:hypothetical protein